MKELNIEYDGQRNNEFKEEEHINLLPPELLKQCAKSLDWQIMIQSLDKELITIIPKMRKLGIDTFSSCSGCGIKHLFERSGFIGIGICEDAVDNINDLFYRIFADAIDKKMGIAKYAFRSRVSTMFYKHDADRSFFVIKVLGNWWKFGYDIKKFWKYLENILDKMIDEAFSFECLLCGEKEKLQSKEVCFVCQDCYNKKKDNLAKIFGNIENFGEQEYSKVKILGNPIKQLIKYLREEGKYNNNLEAK